jgi:hypothetical protein
MMMRRIKDMEQYEEEKDRSTCTEEPASTNSRKNKNLQDINKTSDNMRQNLGHCIKILLNGCLLLKGKF